MRRSNPGATLGAFVGGAILGGLVALLFAPRSGAETREMIRDYVDDEVDMLKARASDARDMVEDQIGKYKRKARRAVSEIEDMVSDAKDFAQGEIAHVRNVKKSVRK